jgi:ergothioneine biosynthesis protein EgtB
MAKVMTNPFPLSDNSQSESLSARYQRIRQTSLDLVAPLEIEDMVVQSMPDASPTRWHLAHTSWFFEHFLLAPGSPGFKPFHEDWDYLFNSYYYSVGDMHKRPHRGLLSRPTVSEVLEYRQYVDARMMELIDRNPANAKLEFLVALGLNHEQQHQELILTDIKHALSCNPLKPAYRGDLRVLPASAHPHAFTEFPGGIVEIGCNDNGFCFDNETPRHRLLLNPFEIGSRLITNAEFREFIEDGGYRRHELWLSDGWAHITDQQVSRPVYWSEDLNSEFSLLGEIDLDPHRSVCHVSYYEADAFARWSGTRLPGEAEWEQAAVNQPVSGNLLDRREFHPAGSDSGENISQLFGDVWEWTQSPYSAYPGYEPLAGSLGEYNGKFMCNQMVLRGGSCATPRDHIRSTYRNFFNPSARWQFSGIRLAKDI